MEILNRIFKKKWVPLSRAAVTEGLELGNARKIVKRKGVPNELRDTRKTITVKELFVDQDEFRNAVNNLPSRRRKK